MNPGRKILVTGASGFLGWNICRVASERARITGIFNRHRVAIKGVASVKCDMTDYRKLKSMIGQLKPDAVIYAAAAANLNIFEQLLRC